MNARYTMTLYDARKTNPNMLDFLDFIDSEHTEELRTAILAMWDIYEIAAETINEQVKYMTDTFHQYKAYYEEKILEYEKKLEWNSKDFYTVYSHSSDSRKGIHSELPNKQIDPDNYFAYPTDTDKADDESDGNVSDKSGLLAIRRQYLSQIKDYYREFALRFSVDFLHMF